MRGQGLAFANAGVVKQRVRTLPPFVRLVAEGSRLHALVVKQPNILALSVYFKSKNFRTLGSCKASDLETPFRFHETYNEHTYKHTRTHILEYIIRCCVPLYCIGIKQHVIVSFPQVMKSYDISHYVI